MTTHFRETKIEGLLKPSVLYPFNKVSHAFLRFADMMPDGFSLEAVVDFTFPERPTVLPGDDFRSDVSVTGSVDVLKPGHQIIMLDRGVSADLSEGARYQGLNHLFERAAGQGNDIIWLTPPGPESMKLLEKHGLPVKVVSETISNPDPVVSNGPDSLAARRLVVAATGPCMGKYTTLLMLQHELRRRQVSVASIATEESGFLLSEFCLANTPDHQRRELLRSALTYLGDYDLILSSGQGGVLDPGPLEWYTPWRITYQMAHFQEFQPHTVILQVHADDPQPKVEDAVSLIRIMSHGKPPIALVIPCARETGYQHYSSFSDGAMHAAKQRLKSVFKIPVFEILRTRVGLDSLADLVINDLPKNRP